MKRKRFLLPRVLPALVTALALIPVAPAAEAGPLTRGGGPGHSGICRRRLCRALRGGAASGK